MATIHYTKRFLTGTLKGISITRSISFPESSLARYAKAFSKGRKGSDCVTHARWEITDASFQSYVR